MNPYLVTITSHETKIKASRQAFRWFRRGLIQWATIIDHETGAMLARYKLRDGRVERMQ